MGQGRSGFGIHAKWLRNDIERFKIVATGASQFEMLKELVAQPDIDWSRVTVFHLDEYVGLSIPHPASILRQHPDTRFFLDKPAASLLK